MIMTTAIEAFCALTSRSRSMPEPSGSMRSQRMRSGSLFWIAARASPSEPAVSTRHPSSSNTMVRKSRRESFVVDDEKVHRRTFLAYG